MTFRFDVRPGVKASDPDRSFFSVHAAFHPAEIVIAAILGRPKCANIYCVSARSLSRPTSVHADNALLISRTHARVHVSTRGDSRFHASRGRHSTVETFRTGVRRSSKSCTPRARTFDSRNLDDLRGIALEREREREREIRREIACRTQWRNADRLEERPQP